MGNFKKIFDRIQNLNSKEHTEETNSTIDVLLINHTKTCVSCRKKVLAHMIERNEV